MKTESNVMPTAQFDILSYENDNVEVLFYENIEETTGEDETVRYSYDLYRLIIRDRDNLKTLIESNYQAWLNIAKIKEKEKLPETESEKIIRLEKENEGLKQTLADLTEVVLLGGM